MTTRIEMSGNRLVSIGNRLVSIGNRLVSSYLDHVMAPFVRNLPSYIKDTKHALQIFQNIHFSDTHKFIFTMDVKSLYTVIPHHDGLRALKFFLDKRPVQEPSTSVLVRLAELVLTLNNFSFFFFSFDGEHRPGREYLGRRAAHRAPY